MILPTDHSTFDDFNYLFFLNSASEMEVRQTSSLSLLNPPNELAQGEAPSSSIYNYPSCLGMPWKSTHVEMLSDCCSARFSSRLVTQPQLGEDCRLSREVEIHRNFFGAYLHCSLHLHLDFHQIKCELIHLNNFKHHG